MKEKKKLLNDDIKVSKVKLIDEEGKPVWEMSLNDAKNLAREAGLDLMQLSGDWDLAIVKMLDYWKFLYKQKKQEQKNKQRTKAPDLKTIKITFKIWEHDLIVKKNQAQKFAQDWHPLKIVLILKWRENQYEDIARDKIETFVNMLDDFYKIDKNLVKAWSNFIIMLSPK